MLNNIWIRNMVWLTSIKQNPYNLQTNVWWCSLMIIFLVNFISFHIVFYLVEINLLKLRCDVFPIYLYFFDGRTLHTLRNTWRIVHLRSSWVPISVKLMKYSCTWCLLNSPYILSWIIHRHFSCSLQGIYNLIKTQWFRISKLKRKAKNQLYFHLCNFQLICEKTFWFTYLQ